MKLNATPRHYMPLPQNQSDDEESGPSKEEKVENMDLKNSFDSSEALPKVIGQSIAEEDDPKKLPMSPLRIVMFILSLIMCVLFIVIFVFFIPCMPQDTLESTCHLASRWTKVLHNMSFSSPLAFVGNDLLENSLILLGYTSEESGLLALKESDGSILWQLPLHSSPYSCLCDIVDANSDGLPECLVVGDNGLLTAVDIKKGISLWYLHNHSDLSNAGSISRPTVLPDCDGDNIPDLVISYNLSNEENSFYLALVSGGTGRIIGSLLDLPQCTRPVSMQLSMDWRNKTDFVFYCMGEKNGNLWIVSAKNLCNVALNETDVLKTQIFYRVPHFASDIQFYKVTSAKNELVIVLDGVKFILLQRTTQYNFKTLWKIYLESHHHMRVVSDGEFTEGSFQLVISSSDSSQSKVLGLNLVDGNEEWFVSQDNVTISSVMKLPMFFGNVDGLVLKTLTAIPFYEQEETDVKSSTDYSSKNYELSNNAIMDNSLTTLQENYILVKCGKKPEIKTLHAEETLNVCRGNLCKPDAFTKNTTALATASERSDFVDLLVVSSTLIATNNTVQEVEMIVNFLNLERVMNISSCGN